MEFIITKEHCFLASLMASRREGKSLVVSPPVNSISKGLNFEMISLIVSEDIVADLLLPSELMQ